MQLSLFLQRLNEKCNLKLKLEDKFRLGRLSLGGSFSIVNMFPYSFTNDITEMMVFH